MPERFHQHFTKQIPEFRRTFEAEHPTHTERRARNKTVPKNCHYDIVICKSSIRTEISHSYLNFVIRNFDKCSCYYLSYIFHVSYASFVCHTSSMYILRVHTAAGAQVWRIWQILAVRQEIHRLYGVRNPVRTRYRSA